MHLEASRLAQVTSLPVRKPAPAPAPTLPGRIAEVYDLAAERERRSPPPAEALAAVDAAARVYQELDAAGLRVRLDLTRGVSAHLHTHDGAHVRPLTLHEVVDPSGLLPPEAA
ncbi:MAG: hypothetical protein U0S48_01195 [Solirubrobacteraceae bacterium]